MLIVDDNRINLLKMKEKLLKITKGNQQKLLDEYKELVLSIDRDEYNALIDKIRNNNYINLPLEEQVIFLNDIYDNYNSLNELQYRYRNVYEEYAQDTLDLSDINNILIDNISERSNAIQAYLMNNKNLEGNKIELEKLNLSLVDALKRQNLIDSKINEINHNLRDNFLSSEGRIISDNNELIYTSAIQEYKSAGFDLKQLINDPEKAHQELIRTIKEQNENKETLEAAFICYKGDSRNEEIYTKIKEDVRKSGYIVVLMEFVNEMCTDTNDYDLMINKLYRLSNLIEERRVYLNKKFYIDPFDRIKVNEQMDILNELGDNREEITNIKKTIIYFTDNIASIEEMNRDLLKRINEKERLLNENVALPDDKELPDDDEKVSDFNAVEYFSDKTYEDNQIKKINNIATNFNLNRAFEKASGVIARVNELLGNSKEKREITPELVIEDVKDETNIDSETLPINAVFPEKKQNDNLFEDNIDINNVFTDTNEKEKSTAADLFQEVKPFEETPLFTERYDDIFDAKNSNVTDNVISNDKNDQEIFAEMPDAFWEIKEEKNEENQEEEPTISFDEQIDRLMNNNDNAKIKKRVA